MLGLSNRTLRTCLVLSLLLSLVSAARQSISRAESIGVLASKEVPLYFIACSMSSNEQSCQYSIDLSYNQEPSQCSVSQLEYAPSWIGILTEPAYISEVTILSVDQTFGVFNNGLNRVSVDVNQVTCFEHLTPDTFIKRTFPCDQIGHEITIAGEKNSAIMICEVDVLGVPLKLPNILGDVGYIPIDSCTMDPRNSSACAKIYDKTPSSCMTLGAGLYLELNFATPSFVSEILLHGAAPGIVVKEDTCKIKSSTNPLKYSCTHFGDSVKLVNTDTKASQTICEVEVFGYESNFRLPPAYRYLGCIPEGDAEPNLPHLASRLRVTTERCYNLCKHYKYKYFGLRRGSDCNCGQSFGKAADQAQDETKCQEPCEGELGELCGSEGFSRIFEILEQQS